MPATLHVLQVLPALNTGGVERGTIEMARAIVEAGGQALVASAGGRLVPELERVGGRHVTLPLASKNPLTIWRNAGLLTDLVHSNDITLVHARSRAPAWSALLAARRGAARFVTTWHGVYSEDFPFKRHYNAVMGKGERVIAISRFVAERLRTQYGVEEERLRIVPRGVDIDSFDPARIAPERVARLARDWGLAADRPASRPIVMLPGRVTRWKGQDVLVEAFGRMANRDALCVLVGGHGARDDYARSLAQKAEALGIADRVRLVGDCADMPAALILADIVVSASTKPEPFGRVVIEAQAMHRPVIAPDHGAAVETIRQGETGWRVPPNDPRALADALDRALTMSASERAAMGQRAATDVVRQGYTTAAMCAATLGVYRELL